MVASLFKTRNISAVVVGADRVSWFWFLKFWIPALLGFSVENVHDLGP